MTLAIRSINPTMDHSYLPVHSAASYDGHSSSQEDRRPKFLSAIGNLVSKSMKKPLRPRRRSDAESFASSRASSGQSRPSSQVETEQSSVPRATWKRRGQTPDMDDYLSMSQLEDVWSYQDSYTGAVETPLTAKSYSFQEISEAPTFVKHKHYHSVNTSLEDLSNYETSPSVSIPDDSAIVDGVVHPALRSTPYLQTLSGSRSTPQLPRVHVSSIG